MKKCSLILAVLLIMLINPIGVRADEPDLASNAKSAIMIEASTGEILYQKNIQDKYAPASMTKMMSLLLFIEQIESGKIKWDQLVTVSANASSMGGSQIYLKTDEKMMQLLQWLN